MSALKSDVVDKMFSLDTSVRSVVVLLFLELFIRVIRWNRARQDMTRQKIAGLGYIT